MAKARVNIQDVVSFRETIRIETPIVSNVKDSFANYVFVLLEEIDKEKEKIAKIIPMCAQEIIHLEQLIHKLEIELAEAEHALAVTPPTIEISVTDDNGNTHTEVIDNPVYLGLLAKIASLEFLIAHYQSAIVEFEKLKFKAIRFINKLSDAKLRIDEARMKVNHNADDISRYSDEAIPKLSKIENTLDEYTRQKIEAPDFSVFKPGVPGGGGFLDNINFESPFDKRESPKKAPEPIPLKFVANIPCGESPDVFPNGYKNDRIKEMFLYVDEHYDNTDAEWIEAAFRYKEKLLRDLAKLGRKLRELNSSQTYEEITLQGQIKQINEIINSLTKHLGKYQSDFVGFKGSEDFAIAYESFITNQQGNVCPMVQGNCGIIASQSVVNQQNGERGTEVDAIKHAQICNILTDNGSPRRNGATSILERQNFLRSKNVSLINRSSQSGNRISLNELAEHLLNGESIMMRVFGDDLSQKSLGSRSASIFDKVSSSRVSVKVEIANHSVIVAGLTKDNDGNYTGVYINDTGGFTSSNRVWISQEKFNNMQARTKRFGVEYCRRMR